MSRRHILIANLILACGLASGTALAQDDPCANECRVEYNEGNCGAPPGHAPLPEPGPEPDEYIVETWDVAANGRTTTKWDTEDGAHEHALLVAENNAADQCRERGGSLVRGKLLFGGRVRAERYDNGKFKVWVKNAKFQCRDKRPNPAHREWRETKRKRRDMEREQARDDDEYEDCLTDVEYAREDCERECRIAAQREERRKAEEERQREAEREQQGEVGDDDTASSSSGSWGGDDDSSSETSSSGSWGGDDSSSGDSDSSDSWGGGDDSSDDTASSGSWGESDSGDSSSSSSSDSGSGSSTTGDAAAVGSAVGEAAAEEGDSTGTAAGAGGAGAVGAGALVAGAGTGEDANEEILKPPGRAKPWLTYLGVLGIGGFVYAMTELINKTNKYDLVSDRARPRDMAVSPLYGPDGLGSWWGRLSVQFDAGVRSYKYDGYLNVSNPYPLEATFVGTFARGRIRYGLFRASVGYISMGSRPLEEEAFGIGEHFDAREPGDVVVTPMIVASAVQWSFGVQAFQGLLGPYAELQGMRMIPSHEISSNSTGNLTLYTPPNRELVIGNTFDFSSMFSTKGPMRRSLVIDVGLGIPLSGVVRGGFQLGIGYTATWF